MGTVNVIDWQIFVCFQGWFLLLFSVCKSRVKYDRKRKKPVAVLGLHLMISKDAMAWNAQQNNCSLKLSSRKLRSVRAFVLNHAVTLCFGSIVCNFFLYFIIFFFFCLFISFGLKGRLHNTNWYRVVKCNHGFCLLLFRFLHG